MRFSKNALGPWMELIKNTWANGWTLWRTPCAHGRTLLRIHWYNTWAVVSILYHRQTFVRKSLLGLNIKTLFLLNSWTFSNFLIRKTLQQTIKFKYEAETRGNLHENNKRLVVFLQKKWSHEKVFRVKTKDVSWLQNWLSTVSDAILSSIDHPGKKHL